MAMREYNTYDMYGLLQGLLDALGKHANAIPLQARVELAKSVIDALPGHPEDIVIEPAPTATPRQQRARRAPSTPTVLPPLSPLGEFIAH